MNASDFGLILVLLGLGLALSVFGGSCGGTWCAGDLCLEVIPPGADQ